VQDAYLRLLDGTIHHLESLRDSGVSHLRVAPETLAALAGRPRPNAPAIASPALVRPVARAAPLQPVAAPSSNLRAVRPAEPSAEAVDLPASVPVISSAEKAAAIAQLKERALACQKCPNLAAARTQVVFGVGDINAQLMFVGEAPGADEDAAGEPFVGKAGQLLTKIIQAMGLDRDHVYIANILKCRPDTPGQASGNRKPTLAEMKTCSPYVLSQIDLIQPKAIVALGGTAVEGLLGNFTGIMRLRGNWQTFRGIPVMPTYHPAFLLRNQSMEEKRKLWEDMLKVMDRLQLPISEKQRGFFQKAAGQ
jgi:uracil-DNA glycosylase